MGPVHDGVTVPAITIKEEVEKYFKDIPVMVEIAQCESRFRHYTDKGNILRGEKNWQDIGVMQINERFHLKDSKELGFDIYSLGGNLAYARYLYEEEGTKPWKHSKRCWKPSILAFAR